MTWVWQGITVAAMGGLIFVAAKAFLPLVRVPSLGKASQGAYSFRSSSVCWLRTLRLKRTSTLRWNDGNGNLPLNSRPFGRTDAPVEEAGQIPLEIGGRSFGRDENSLGSKAERSPASVVDVLMKSTYKEFRQFVAEIVKAARG